MKDEEKYLEHIKEADELTKKAIKECGVSPDYAKIIFEKAVSPHYYFIQNTEQIIEPATEKQIAYAQQLGIDNPEQYNKKELSKKIEDARKQ